MECTWTYSEDEYHYYSTSCGEDFVLVDGTPEENNYNYCPQCGGKIIEPPKD